MRRAKQSEVVRITGAQESLTDDSRTRERRYIVSMAVRTVSFVAAVALLHGWARWTGVVIAVVLPWFAVVVANIGRAPARAVPLRADRPGARALTAQPGSEAPRTVTITVPGSVGAATGDTTTGDHTTGHTTTGATAPGPDGPVELTTSRRA